MGTQTARVAIAVGCLMGLCDAFFVDRLAMLALREDPIQWINKRKCTSATVTDLVLRNKVHCVGEEL